MTRWTARLTAGAGNIGAAEATPHKHALASLRGSVIAGRLGTRRRRLWAAVGALGSVLTAGTTAVILLLSSGASVAYAGWSAVPSTVTPAVLASVTEACNRAAPHNSRHDWPLLYCGTGCAERGARPIHGRCLPPGCRTRRLPASPMAQRRDRRRRAAASARSGSRSREPIRSPMWEEGAGAAPGFGGGDPNQPAPTVRASWQRAQRPFK